MNPESDHEDRKLNNEATPVQDDNQMTDPSKGSEMNKVDIKNADDYDKMDLIVNDIKQVIFFYSKNSLQEYNSFEFSLIESFFFSSFVIYSN